MRRGSPCGVSRAPSVRAMSVSAVPQPEPVAWPALPEDGPRLALAAPSAELLAGRTSESLPKLWRLAAQADSLLTDMSGLFDSARIRQQVNAVAALLRDAADAVAAADADVASARAEASRVDEEAARLWRTVSADVATRRAATDAFVARAVERAEREADAVLGDATAKADLLVARAEDLVATWLDEANAEVGRILASAPAPPSALAASATGPSRPRSSLWRLFRRRRSR